MTREEAILELQALYVYMSQWIGSYEDAKRINDAITMAINALKTISYWNGRVGEDESNKKTV